MSTIFLTMCSDRYADTDLVAGPSSKKKQLNETELQMRREETARKRRNMTEKKLEDEKVRILSDLFILQVTNIHRS